MKMWKCERCGKTVKKRKKYCSRACHNPPVFIYCKQCNKKFRISPSRIKRQKYCSDRCKGLAIFNIPKNRKNNIKSLPKGEKHYKWKRGYWINKQGYKIFETIEKTQGKRVFEHRLVMENHIGRKLRKNEIIHHIDGNKLNNNIYNLKILSQSEHALLHYRLNPQQFKKI